MPEEHLVQELLNQYVYQKQKLISNAGGKISLNRDRLRLLMRPRIERMAEVIEEWDVPPEVVMTAVFAWALSHKHPDGPMPTMLYSVKYLTSAISYYLQVPYEVVMEKRSHEAFLSRMDREFDRFRSELESAGVTDLITATSYPVETRYVLAITTLDWEAVFYLSQELLETMTKDKRVEMWLLHRGLRYESIAAQFNKKKKNMMREHESN